MARGLSDLQKAILMMAYQNRFKIRSAEKRVEDFNRGRPHNYDESMTSYELYIHKEDIFYNEFVGTLASKKTNSIKVSVSRAFKRLQERELIERSYFSHHNHMSANLTIKGIKVAESLLVNTKISY